MQKENVQDIVMPSQRGMKTTAGIRRSRPPRRPSDHEDETYYDDGPKRGKSIWFIALASLVALALVFAFFLSGVSVKVTPKMESVFVDGQFLASAETGDLTYDVLSLDLTETKAVPATDEEQVSERASGTIVVFNNFDDNNQRLIKNTRFETSDGKIYRIQESIVVPGKASDGTPGSIEVTVFADETGDSFNIGLSDFTIPGFEGTPRFEGFYARSRTPMTGGFEGTRLIVSEQVTESTRDELQETLRQELLSSASAQIPEGYVLYDDGVSFVFESMPNQDSEGETTIQERGTIHAIIFDEEELAEHLAETTIGTYGGEPVEILNAEELAVSFVRSDARLWEQTTIDLTITGTAELRWILSESDIQRLLAGRDKSEVQELFSSYPGIAEAEATIKPFWQSSFPVAAEDIQVRIQN